MDKNTIIGFSLMGVLLLAMTWFNRPSPEQLEVRKHLEDSIARVEHVKQLEKTALKEKKKTGYDVLNDNLKALPDSLKKKELSKQFGALASSIIPRETKNIVLSNDKVLLKVSNKGAQIVSAQLKEYKTHDGKPLFLFKEKEASFDASLVTTDNRIIHTSSLFFKPLPIEKTETGQKLTMRLYAGENNYIDYTYLLENDDYMVRFKIKSVNMEQILSHSMKELDLEWNAKLRQQEKGRKFEERYTGLYYMLNNDKDVESLSASSDDSEKLNEPVKWIGYKDQFFSSVFIAEKNFVSTELESEIIKDQASPFLKDFSSKSTVKFDIEGRETTDFRFYFGPNNYTTLKEYDSAVSAEDELHLQKMVRLGNVLFRWVNKILVIPMFNFLDNYIASYGIIILILTVFIKLILFPLTYKSYMSQAKMRVLRPQVEELNKKYEGSENAMKKQQATMELYSRAGASPMSGCLPMVLQMPILIALFMFFPSSIELRQESFLWATDLSTYDAIISWDANIPIISTFYGNHVSLFCLLMTIVNLIYTRFNMQLNNTGQQQMPGMNLMMYFMPLMFLFFFNQYSAGLSYYYLLSTLITIGQTMAFRYFINEEKLLLKLEENKKRPKKTNGFMSRLQEAQRLQQEEMRKKQEAQKKNKK